MQAGIATVVQAQMLIRKPVVEVFNAFIYPDIASRYWITQNSGMLETGKKIGTSHRIQKILLLLK